MSKTPQKLLSKTARWIAKKPKGRKAKARNAAKFARKLFGKG